MSPGHVVVRLKSGSDGDATHVPASGVYTQVDPPLLYLEKTAQQWMDRRGEARKHVKYILERLPAGYTMWQRPRPGKTTHVDKYLFGHPDHKKFDSPNRFYPHFEHLMENGGSSMGCPCTVCAGSAGVLPKNQPSSSVSSQAPTPKIKAPRISQHFSAAPQQLGPRTAQPLATASRQPAARPRARPKVTSAGYDTSRVDDEGTPDVYRNLIDKLRRHGTIDEKIEEPLSPDWRAENEILPKLLQELRREVQWKPRRGEVVLFVRFLPDELSIVQDENTGEYQVYNEHADKSLGTPMWEAGLVGQTPSEGTSDNVIYSGVRVEPLPNPNESNKSLSKHYKYVPLRQTRPFVLWEQFLGSVPQDDWHPTIHNALTITSTLSLIGKHRFRGTWPNASIYCHAMYLGFELLAVGDTVRLLPSAASGLDECCDIMIIKSIRIKWSNLDKASNNDYDEGRPYNSAVWIYGTAFTNDASRSDKQWLSSDTDSLKAAAQYSKWYPLHPPSKELAIPHTRCMGRVYERDAMSAFLNADGHDLPNLDMGRSSLLKARAFSVKHDQRILKDHATWYWGDNRADSLGLHTINGLDVTKFDELRDVKDLRNKLKLLDADSGPSGSILPTAHTAPSSRRLRGFMAPNLPPTPDRHVANKAINGSSSMASSLGSEIGLTVGLKRMRADSTSDEDEGKERANDDEIRQSTVIVEETATARKKKPMVQVVIDD
ncbi:hypothetical protein T440DRAFT_390092 [Plenodomus tracheiphilus IPT5]|uniref:Cryptic loci regulator 2 N-terminal domain-containing protein n=1 Tax=Plenodomus tracheiphilus IPT5 TaxID=1408161 RepID=A0A6A7BDN2_9PLEO|nr:hypothetical protein T440DRAFT_390092 [Plenodomus tracheiphilus IPT5]